MKHFPYCLILLLACSACTPEPEKDVKSILRQMEQGVKNSQPMQIAAIYADDSYVINPNRIEAQGREAIDEYWQNLGNASTDWNLQSFIVGEDLDAILQSRHWQQLERKPRLPEELGISLSGDLLYHLGQSELTISDGEDAHVSTVNFLIVWKVVDGEYRIWIDSYA